jgi:AcrR family transcriptional regulator
MELKQTNTEQAILEAAEKVFIQKGYAETRTTDIAKQAGVNHAMLHYYFRTKEALFDRIFKKKASEMLESLVKAFDNNLPFFEKVKCGIEAHFDFLSQEPGMPFFIIRDIIQNEERKRVVYERVAPIVLEMTKRVSNLVEVEVRKGTIRPVTVQDLALNIVALNVFAFIAVQVIFNLDEGSDSFKQFLEERKRVNVETIINSIKLDTINEGLF